MLRGKSSAAVTQLIAQSLIVSRWTYLSLILGLYGGCTPVAPELNSMPRDYGFPSTTEDQISTTLDASSDDQGTLTSQDPTTWPDLEGWWIVDQKLLIKSELPVIFEEVDTLLEAVLLLEVKQSDDELWLHYRICDVRLENTPAFNQTLISDGFINALERISRPAQLERDSSGDFVLIVPKMYELRGVWLTDPENELLPDHPDDPRVYDQDEDGRPGLSARLVGFPEGEVNLIQRMWDIWQSQPFGITPESVAPITGQINWHQEQIILNATNRVLEVDVRRWIPTDSNLHHFEMRRIELPQCPPRRENPSPD